MMREVDRGDVIDAESRIETLLEAEIYAGEYGPSTNS